jgi:hypothetical protein
MKPILLLLALSGTLFAVDPRNTSVTPEELLGNGDFDADGDLDSLVIDRPTGLFRLGVTQPDGSVQWQAARATGCPDAQSMGVGFVRSPGALDLIVTGPSANQVFLLSPLASFSRPQTVIPSGIGPVSVAAVDLAVAGNDPARLDLVTLTGWNSDPNPFSSHLHQSLAGGISAGASVVLPNASRRGSRVILKTGDPELYADFESGATSTFRVVNTQNPALPIKTSLAGLPANADFVHARFLVLPRYQFVFFAPGQAGLLVSDTNPATGALQPTVAKTIGTDPVRSVHVVNDGIRPCLAIIYNDGTHGDLYHFDAAGDPVFDTTFNPPPGQKLKGVLGYAAGNFQLLSGPPGGGSSTSVRYDRSSGSWQRGAESSMSSLGSVGASANVFLYQTEPLVDPAAKLIETIQVPDWTSGLLIDGAGNVSVTAEGFGNETDGLQTPTANALGIKPAGTAFGLANQYRAEVSISSDQHHLGVTPLQVGIDPPAGTYSRYITPRLTVPNATGISAFYRFGSSGAWVPFDLVSGSIVPPRDTLAPFSVGYYAVEAATGRRSPVYQASYSFAGDPGTQDSDGDGVPDFVELNRGLDPLAGADSDEDGISDFEEFVLESDPANGSETVSYGANTLALPPSRTHDEDGDGFSDFTEWASGSDPFNPSSVPAAEELVEYRNVFDLNARPLSQSGNAGVGPDRESFKVNHATYSSTTLRLHDTDGRLVQTAPTDFQGTGAPLPNPFARFESVPATGRDLFMVLSTPTAFDIVQDAGLPGWGREIFSLVPVPSLRIPPVPYTYSGGSTASATTAWITAAQTHYDSQPRHVISANFDLYDSLALLVFEKLVDFQLRDRGTLTGGAPISLTPFRDTDPSARQVASAETLRSLQNYVDYDDHGWHLQTIHNQIRTLIRNSPNARMAALRKLGLEVHRISAALTDISPGLYPSPFETLRTAVQAMSPVLADADGLIPLPGDPVGPDPATSYAAAHTLTPAEMQSADESLAWIRGQITPRPVEFLTAVIVASSFSGTVPVIQNDENAALLRLYDADGNPFRFPEALDLPVGTYLAVSVFTDRTDLPAGTGTARETISAVVTSFPTGTRTDADFNGIEDAYENHFFGGPVGPFGDEDGDGYINLQEYLEGTHPADPGSAPAVPPLPRRMPPVRISQVAGGELRFELNFPSAYASRIRFILQSGNMTVPFAESPSSEASSNELDTYVLQIPRPAAARGFYRFRLALRP